MSDPEPISSILTDEQPAESGKQTAEKAKQWLIEARAGNGYRGVNRKQRLKVAQAFAGHNRVVYGQAFDLVRIAGGTEIDLDDLEALTGAVGRKELILVEVKASRISRSDARHFGGHFFSISTAELLVAQSLGDLYRFAFVNTKTKEAYEVSLQQIYARAKAIYPTWSIRLTDGEFPPDTAL